MNPVAILPLSICIALETAEQILYRAAGANRRRRPFFIGGGVMIHVVLLIFWFWVLKILPLGIAMPCLGVNYATVALASRWIFNEKIDSWRWTGITVIILGLALIGGAHP